MCDSVVSTPIDKTPGQAPQSSPPLGAPPIPDWHPRFLQILPVIRRQASFSFRTADPAAREEAVQEVIANALVAYARLVDQGKEQVALATPLAGYAIAQVRAGRKIGSRLNVHDVSSRYCHARKGVRLESLSDDWREITVESRRATPAEVAAVRIDFASWLATLSPRNRRLAERLAIGETTSAAASAFGISPRAGQPIAG